MSQKKYTDNDVLVEFLKHENYLNEEYGINAMYTIAYQATPDEMEDLPKSPLLNWWMY